MYSIRMMPFFTSRPISRIAPMNDDTFSGVPVIHSGEQGAGSATTAGREKSASATQALELDAEQAKTPAPPPRTSTVNRLANDSCWLRYAPPVPSDSPAETISFASRLLHVRLTDPRSRSPQFGGHRDHRLLVFAMQFVGLRWRFDRRHMTKRYGRGGRGRPGVVTGLAAVAVLMAAAAAATLNRQNRASEMPITATRSG